jgi:hypothetical protein
MGWAVFPPTPFDWMNPMKLSEPIYRLFLIAGVLFSLAGCQVSTAPTPRSQADTLTPTQSPPTIPPETAHTPAAGQVQPTGFTGKIISASDVSGQPDVPLPNQMILAVAVQNAARILGAGTETLPEKDLRFLKATLSQADPAILVTASNANGEYTLLLSQGEYIVCLANSEQTPPGFPASTRGCGRVQAQAGELRHLDISSGFGEILILP